MNIFSRLLPPSFDPLKIAVLGLCAGASLLASCSQNPIRVNLHAMQSSGRVSFVCRGADNSPLGHKLDECPDRELGTRHTLALVTQTATNEVAVVDLYAQSILDIDQTTPGYSFLRVGAKPGAIVTTPGGAATFVGVSGLQKDGIFALPTTCVMPPRADLDEAARDLTSWPACHLSSAPGDMAVVIDPVMVGNEPRVSCLSSPTPAFPPKEENDTDCPADVAHEPGPVGRRKLLVALPDEHKLVLVDAQRLLEQKPGAFPECEVEATFALQAELPKTSISPILPSDLTPAESNACSTPSYPPHSVSAPPTPGGFAALGNRVYVADRTQPVVHVLDVSDPCTDKELEPLLPYSYTNPARVVTTSRVAVSPLSPSGTQFVYAIDQDDQPAASLMAFDVTRIDARDASTRTPLIFPGAPRQRPDSSNPAPDRLRFNASVRDVSFVMRDFPKPDPTTGAGEFGLACEPDPNASGPATLYRPNSDYSDGARPINLRGVFGFAMLTNGQIAVIDVEDFDKNCRRPVTTNIAEAEDLHGCSSDETSAPYTLDGARTVTDESSCHIVEPHRLRSAALSISSSSNGLRAPSLRTFPQFSTPGSTVPLDKQPHMMATDFQNPVDPQSGLLPAEVNVNAELYVHCDPLVSGAPPCDGRSGEPLGIDPTAEVVQNSLTLPLIEPRSYAQDEAPSLTFEGALFPARNSGFLDVEEGASEGRLRDPDANFCGAGVEDSESIAARGTSLGIPQKNLGAWSEAHADYVQITGDYPAPDDQYWVKGQGQRCAEAINPSKPGVPDRDACVGKFGTIDNPATLKAERNLSVLSATAGQLIVTPRGCTGDSCVNTLKQLSCCFPAGTAYTVRASNQWLVSGTSGLHDLAVGPTGRCEHTATCDRRKQYFNQRAFEVCDPSLPPETHTVPGFDENGQPIDVEVTDFTCVKTDPKVGCVGEQKLPDGKFGPKLPVVPGDLAAGCIFENLTSRFVVYHGAQPNVPGTAFTWQTTGGFLPQTMSMVSQSSAVSPQSLGYLPELDYLAVVDASTLGLMLFDLNSLGVVAPSPYY